MIGNEEIVPVSTSEGIKADCEVVDGDLILRVVSFPEDAGDPTIQTVVKVHGVVMVPDMRVSVEESYLEDLNALKSEQDALAKRQVEVEQQIRCHPLNR